MDKREREKANKKKNKSSQSDEPSTTEEKFLDSSLYSVQLHAKAKLLVNDMMETVLQKKGLRPKTKSKKNQLSNWDTFNEWGNFDLITKKLTAFLLSEDPELARKMGVITHEDNDLTNFNVGTLDQDDEEEGLEA